MFISSMPCMLLEVIPLQLLLVLNRDKKFRDHILDLVEYTSISMVYVVSILIISYCKSMVDINFAFIVSAWLDYINFIGSGKVRYSRKVENSKN